MSDPPAERNHLFISYATENFSLAEWLTLKLTALGYEVWCDQIKLLGGEPYPQEIDDALENKTFRVLYLLSRASKDKPNPVKERTKAVNIGRARKIDFLIPLNVDGLGADELPWMTADLSFIPFGDWADGLTRLLKKLDSIDAPRNRADGQDAARAYFNDVALVEHEPEIIWSNMLEVLELPSSIHRVRNLGDNWINWPSETLYYRNGSDYWTFSKPDVANSHVQHDDFPCDPSLVVNGLPLLTPITFLVRNHLSAFCRSKGLAQTERERRRGDLYFPSGLVPNNKINFQIPGSRRNWIAPTGERRFIAAGQREYSRYHLAFSLRPMLYAFDAPAIQVQAAVWLTDLNGVPLAPEVMNRRRKALCRNWYNHQWLVRTYAIVSWLADGRNQFEIFRDGQNAIVLSGRPLQLEAPVRLNEDALERLPINDEADINEADADAMADSFVGRDNDSD